MVLEYVAESRLVKKWTVSHFYDHSILIHSSKDNHSTSDLLVIIHVKLDVGISSASSLKCDIDIVRTDHVIEARLA
jgi:hypothetical protein